MPKYWMISDRTLVAGSLGKDVGRLTYWISDVGAIDNLASWFQVSAAQFQTLLLGAVQTFPVITDPARHEDQKHVTLFVHGYNNTWGDAALRYQSLSDGIFTTDDSLGVCLFFTWPSKGAAQDYLPDRAEARAASPDLATILSAFYDWLLTMQQAAAGAAQPAAAGADPAAGAAEAPPACRAKVSMIAHSMGNFVLQKAMQTVWTRKNRPLLVSLLNQLLMVAADVDNDIFKSGEATHDTDGDAIANLSYRVTALYSGRDPVLGVSAGLKHFGKRRLGRSGLDRTCPVPDNVWQVDCTPFFNQVEGFDIHSAYFTQPGTLELIREVLKGTDRTVLAQSGLVTV